MTDAGSPTGVGLGLRWAFIDEVAEGRAPASIPFYEISPENYIRRGGRFPAALESVASQYPLLTHGLMLGIGGEEALEPGYIGDLRAFLDTLGATGHSDHLCWSSAEGRCLHDLLPLPVDRRIIPAVSDRIRRVQDLLGRPFAVENISYYGAPGWSTEESRTMGMAERDLLAELLDRSQCGLLLDVNNVLVNATNHGFDPYDYLAGLDLSRVIQLHVAGGERLDRFDDLLIDTHGASVPVEVEALMEWVIARTGPLPVIYERDNSIPPLAQLGEEVAGLQATYERALETHSAQHHLRLKATPRTPAVTELRPWAELGATQRGFARRVLDLRGESDDDAAAGVHGGHPEDPEDPSVTAALHAIGDARLGVYRGLVRGSLHNLLRNLLPRTLARLEDRGPVWIDRWLATAGPRSRILRELIDEWVEWASPRWLADPDVPDYLVDLLRHEAVEMAVEAAQATQRPPGIGDAFDLDGRLVFDPSARIERYDHAIHRLPEDVDDRSHAPQETTTLLVYRDPAHDVRYLHLSPIAAAVSSSLLAGRTVRAALIAGAAAVAVELDDSLLSRMSHLFADLADRGVLWGSHPA